MERLPTLVAVILACILATCPVPAAGDWPQYRHDAGRTAATSESLPATLHLQWVRELPSPRPAFPGEIRLRYDATYEPVIAGTTMFVPSMVTDTVTALDTDTGEERWQFFTEGPVRFAPAVWEGKVYFVSDDGYLYCVNATDGKLLWRFRGLPADRRDRKVMGNGRLVSLIPARGGPVLADGIVYFAAGIWSGEGVFVHALNAETGQAIWSNTDSDRIEAANMDYGGTACLALLDGQRRDFIAAVSDTRLAGLTARETEGLAVVTRDGPLPDSADWSHNEASAANTGASLDRSLKAPLARLWFDGSFRWFRTPGASLVRVAGGRMFVHADKLYAIDIFTGRHLWQRPSVGRSDDRMVAVEDAIYLASGRSCLVFDPANGEKTDEINLPDDIPASWSIIRVMDDSLVGACGESLVCMDRRDGNVIWQQKRQAKIGCLALGGGRVFCADFVNKRRDAPTPDASIEALDAKTGQVLWQTSGGAEIRFSEPHDLVCTSNGVYRGSDGKRLWGGQVFLVAGDKLISGGKSQVAFLDPQTGRQMGKTLEWNLRGCTMLRGSSTLLTTRFMGNAAYLDIAMGKITSIWNVRAACSNNLFPADGILNVPNLSGGCTCNYMPVSQALVPAAAVEQRAGFSRAGE